MVENGVVLGVLGVVGGGGGHLKAGHSLEATALVVDGPLVRQHVDEIQPMALAGLEIVGVVRGCDLHGTSPKRHVHKHGVSHYGDAPPIQGVHRVFAHCLLVPALINPPLTA